MRKGQKSHIRQRFLRLTNCHIVDQMPALIENIMHDAHIYILQIPDIIPGNLLRLLIKSFMHNSCGRRVIMPDNRRSVAGIGDLHPLQPWVQKNAPTLLIRAGFAHQDLQLYPGFQKHLDLIRHYIHQRVSSSQTGKHRQNCHLHKKHVPPSLCRGRRGKGLPRHPQSFTCFPIRCSL